LRYFCKGASGKSLAAQHFQHPLEVVVGLEAQHDVPLVLALDLDLDAQAELLPQLVLDALDVGRLARRGARLGPRRLRRPLGLGRR
jgi:hypothetical protein